MRSFFRPTGIAPELPSSSEERCERKRVYIFARKTLTRNTRIFKQAKSLTDAGYEVLIIGIKPRDGTESERRDGYTLVRLTLRPLHGRIPRAVNRSLVVLERGLLRMPSRVLPATAGEPRLTKVVRRRFTAASRRSAGLVRTARIPLTEWLRRELARIAFPLRSWEYYKESCKLMRSGLPIPEIFHANDLDTLLVATVLARRHRKPLLYDAQELYTGMHTLPRWYADWLQLQERLLIRLADRVTVVNDAIAEVMEQRYGRRVDAVILNCPPYESVPTPAHGMTMRERCGLSDDDKVMVYSGGLAPRRGIENTILALHHLVGWRLVILGEGSLKDELIALAATEGLEDRVRFADFLPHDEVSGFISSADVGVIPYENTGVNHYLCSPSKLFHYLMAELPIACSDFPFLRSVVAGNRVGATFDPADPASIARAVLAIADDPVVYGEIKARTRLVKRRYSWEEEEKRFMTIYESLVPPPVRQ